jgi:hypothetical protein
MDAWRHQEEDQEARRWRHTTIRRWIRLSRRPSCTSTEGRNQLNHATSVLISCIARIRKNRGNSSKQNNSTTQQLDLVRWIREMDFSQICIEVLCKFITENLKTTNSICSYYRFVPQTLASLARSSKQVNLCSYQYSA